MSAGSGAIEDEDKDISRLFSDLAEFALDLQSDFEHGIAEVLANDELITSTGSASFFCSELAPSNDHSELIPSNGPPSSSSAVMLPSATVRIQSHDFSKTSNVDDDCTIMAAPDVDSFTNEFSCENVANLKSLMGSIVIGEHRANARAYA